MALDRGPGRRRGLDGRAGAHGHHIPRRAGAGAAGRVGVTRGVAGPAWPCVAASGSRRCWAAGLGTGALAPGRAPPAAGGRRAAEWAARPAAGPRPGRCSFHPPPAPVDPEPVLRPQFPRPARRPLQRRRPAGPRGRVAWNGHLRGAAAAPGPAWTAQVLERRRKVELASEGMVEGSLQVPPDGRRSPVPGRPPPPAAPLQWLLPWS